jgi:hypothetical protein
MDLVKEAGKEKAEAEAEANEDSSRRDVASNVATNDEADDEEADAKDKKPKNALRKVSKPRVGEDEKYLRYYVLASEVATCS